MDISAPETPATLKSVMPAARRTALYGTALSRALASLSEAAVSDSDAAGLQALPPHSGARRSLARTALVEAFGEMSASSPPSADALLLVFRLELFRMIDEHQGDHQLVFASVYDLLDLSLEASDQGWADPTLSLSLVEDAVDVLTADAAGRLYEYLDSRVVCLTACMEPNKGKGLVLLRLCNEMLRRLSKSTHNVVCGKILTFLSSAFPLSERSGVNMRGDFNTDNKTLFDKRVDAAADAMDVDSVPDASVATPVDAQKERLKSVFYETFWSTQAFFANPTLLFDTSNFEDLKKGIDEILKTFEEIQIDMDGPSGSGSEKRRRQAEKQPSASEIKRDYFFPKFLTSPELFNLELNDPFFRRQILVQCIIVFQFLAGLTTQEKERVSNYFSQNKNITMNKSVHYSYVLSFDQELWVADARKRALKVLETVSPNGKQFSKTLITVITHERNWLKWKLESCRSYELLPTQIDGIRRRKAEVSMAINPAWIGNNELSQLWERGRDLKEVLRFKASRSNVLPLDKQLQDLDYQLEDDGETLAEGMDSDADMMYNDMRYSWLVYRAAVRSHLQLFLQQQPQPGSSLSSSRPNSANSKISPDEKPASGLRPKVPKLATGTSKALVLDLLREWRHARDNAKNEAEAEEAAASATTTTAVVATDEDDPSSLSEVVEDAQKADDDNVNEISAINDASTPGPAEVVSVNGATLAAKSATDTDPSLPSDANMAQQADSIVSHAASTSPTAKRTKLNTEVDAKTLINTNGHQCSVSFASSSVEGSDDLMVDVATDNVVDEPNASDAPNLTHDGSSVKENEVAVASTDAADDHPQSKSPQQKRPAMSIDPPQPSPPSSKRQKS